VIEKLLHDGKLVRVNRMVAIASEQTVLTKKQRAKMDQILELYHGTRTPPTIKELANQLNSTMDAIQSLVRFATQQRVLVELGGGFFIAHDVWMVMLSELKRMFEDSSERSVSEIRDGWKVTRKHAIPMLEYCDRMEYTVRHHDTRCEGRTLSRTGEQGASATDLASEEKTVE
jgi:selenocysteine-specific elongation factor